MNFINHTGPNSLDSGDSLECIGTGIEVAGRLLQALEADMNVSSSSREAFGSRADELREWMQASARLLKATEDENEDDEDDAQESEV